MNGKRRKNMEDTQKGERSGKKVPGVALREPPKGMGNLSFDFLQDLKKGDILHLRDDFRPYMRPRNWVFVDLFKCGGIFLHRKDEGFLEVKVRDIDWEAYGKNKQ
jgi:hypothetical protein